MYHVLLFVALIVIEWVLCLYCANACITGLVLEDAYSLELIKKRWKKIFCVIVCAEMILFAGFRALNVGADTAIYLDALTYYKKLPHGKILSAKLVPPFDFEIGYFFLTKLCACLSFNSTMFLLLIATMTYIPLIIFVYKYSKNPLISLLVYFAFGFFAYSVGLFRQMIALSICLCAVPYIREKKLIRYLLLCVFACLFHLTALIMIPFYFLEYLDIKKHKLSFLIWVVVIEALCFIFARDIILEILKIFKSYAGYEGSKYDIQGGSYFNLLFLNTLLLLGLFAVVPRVDKADTLSVKGIAVACIIQSCAYAMGIMGRLVCYYSVYGMLLIPLLSENIVKEKAVVRFMAVIILFVWIFISLKNDMVMQNYHFF